MKKLIAIAVVLALVAGVAFAADGIEIQAWGRGAFVPLIFAGAKQLNGESKDADGNETKDETYSGVRASWGGNAARIDFRINGSSDFVGFKTQFAGENFGGVGEDKLLEMICDDMNIWAKPFGSDILKLAVGKITDDTLRGKIGNLSSGFENFVLSGPAEEDGIFTHFTTPALGGAPHGYMISSAPIDGLFIGLMVNGEADPWWNNGQEGGTKATNAFRRMQIGAGYNIANIGHIRAQYIGGLSGTIDKTSEDWAKYGDDPAGRIEFAFALTAVQGLLVDLGAKINLAKEFKDESASSGGLDIGLGATFSTGTFGIGARFDMSGLGAYDRTGAGYKDDKSESGATTVIRLVPTFEVGEATIGLDFALKLVGKSKDPDGKDVEKSGESQIGFGAFVKKGLGRGSVMAGLSYTLAPNNWEGKANGISVFQIPIVLEYAFF